MAPFAREPWSGVEKLVIGIDVGTTLTAVSYVHLYPGGPQVVTRVSSWPGQPSHRGSSKIPSVLYYDKKGNPRCCGAEAMSDDARDEAEEDDWRLVRYFKLLLHPAELRTSHNIAVEALPQGLTVEVVYSDFFQYLLKCTRAFFESRTPNGAKIWQQLEDTAEFVIAHPNAWGLKEQHVLRRAAIRADFVPIAQADSHVRFVSEGEASVHFCIVHGNLAAKLKAGTCFLVCDAGGSTIDTIAYIVKAFRPKLELKEVKASGCVQAGGIFVNKEAIRHLRRILAEAQIPEDDVEAWLRISEEEFERSLKLEFPRPIGRHTIAIDRRSNNNRTVGIKNGRLSLTTETVASFFEPCISRIKTTIIEQLSGFAAEHILLVGGFGESRYLQQQLTETFDSPTCDLTFIEDGTSKAVADGAVMWNCLQTVKARVTRRSFGISFSTPYDAANPSHRGVDARRGMDGALRVGPCCSHMLSKDTVVHEDVIKSFVKAYPSAARAEDGLRTFKISLFSHCGIPEANEFMFGPEKTLNPGFESECTIGANLSQLAQTLKPQKGVDRVYFATKFDVGITFGSTELKAFIQWDENGVKRRGPATVIPNYSLTSVGVNRSACQR